MNDALFAGASRRRLEPPVGIAMAGYGRRTGRSTGVHDDLAAQALVLSDGVHKAAIVGVDLLAIGNRIADDIRDRVGRESDIDPDAIMICATHTHSGPLFNIWATPKSSIGWEALLRFDHLKPNTLFDSQVRHRTIVGAAYWFPHQGNVSAALMFDYDAVTFDNFAPARPNEQRLALHGLVAF